MRLKIAAAGEAVLRKPARLLTREEITSTQIRELIEHMRETLRDAPGVGLAAPQVGIDLQLAVIEDRLEYHTGISAADLQERERRPVEFHVIINPQLQRFSPPDAVFFEGCLSLPGFVAMVPRARRVAVDCLNLNGEPVRIEADGWYARILQHEIDHLRGTLYIDRMLRRSFSSIENHGRYWKARSTRELVAEFGQPGTDDGV